MLLLYNVFRADCDLCSFLAVMPLRWQKKKMNFLIKKKKMSDGLDIGMGFYKILWFWKITGIWGKGRKGNNYLELLGFPFWAIGQWVDAKWMAFEFPVGLYLKIRATSIGLVLLKLDLNDLHGTAKFNTGIRGNKQWDMVIFEFHSLQWISGHWSWTLQ